MSEPKPTAPPVGASSTEAHKIAAAAVRQLNEAEKDSAVSWKLARVEHPNSPPVPLLSDEEWADMDLTNTDFGV